VDHIYDKAISVEQDAAATEVSIKPLPQDASNKVTSGSEEAEWLTTCLAAIARGEASMLPMAGG
jgi:hypothetical protein